MSKIEQVKQENQGKIDAALRSIGQFAKGAPFELLLVPNADELDAQVAADSSWAEGLLYQTIAEYLEQFVQNLNTSQERYYPDLGDRLGRGAPKRTLRISTSPHGGYMCATSQLKDGYLDWLFKASSLKTSQAGWSEIGNDLGEVLQAVQGASSASGAVPASEAPTASAKLEQVRQENQGKIDAALAALAQIAHGGPLKLALVPGDKELDALVTAEASWAEGLLYATVAEYLTQLVANFKEQISCYHADLGERFSRVVSARTVRVSISPNGGFATAVCQVNDGNLDLLFRADSLKTNQAGWTGIGLDLHEALQAASVASRFAGVSLADSAVTDMFGPLSVELSSKLAVKWPGIQKQLAALTEYVGDGRPWKLELARPADEMDLECTRENAYMNCLLFDTIEEFLGFINQNARLYRQPLDGIPLRTIVFEFRDVEDLPGQYMGAFQSITENDKLYFVGPASDFKSNGAGAVNIGRDIQRAARTARGESGPTEEEQRLAQSLAAMAGSSSCGGKERPCNMCKGKKHLKCDGCHGSGCNRCKNSGLRNAACPSCKGRGLT